MKNVWVEPLTVAGERARQPVRRGLRALAGLLAVVGLALAAALAVAAWMIVRAWPRVSGNVTLAGLEAPVEILSDRWGTPHIYARNEHDLFFAQGYAQARDRMWQMEFTRRLADGRLSEILGEGSLPFDRLTRVVGMRRGAGRDWEKMQGEERAALIAFADGVNAFLNSRRERLSLEFTIFGVAPAPWTPLDTLLTGKLMCWILSENASIEISRARILAKAGAPAAGELLPPYNEGLPVIVPRGVDGYTWLPRAEGLKAVAGLLGAAGAIQGSNSWALAGSHTASGRPLLANDTHLDLFIPSVWYANDLHGGGIDVAGYSLTGSPGVAIGHNQRIAWAVTDLVADVQDFYIEKLDRARDPQNYEYRGRWLPLEFQKETIAVKGASPVELNVARTRHGPLVNETLARYRDSRPLALAWAGEDSPGIIRSQIRLNRARDWEQFREALSYWDGPDINYVYADTAGNIGYQAAGRVPRRAPGHAGILPIPGWTGEFDWQGFLPFEALPRELNPARGFIVTANQKPVDQSYPYALGYEFADPYRAMRITQMLSASARAGIGDMQAIQGDTYNLVARDLLPYLLAAPPASDLERQALEQVRAWDLRSDARRAAPAIYQAWYRFLVEDTVGDELGPELTEEYMEYYWIHGRAMVRLMREGVSGLFDDIRTPQVETRDDIAGRSFHHAVAWLSKRYGPDPAAWRWGRLHTLTFRHRPFGLAEAPVLSRLFNYGPIAAPGFDRFTVNATWFTTDDAENPYATDAGSAQRIIEDLADWDRTVAVNSTGQTEQLFHKHRDDQIPMWRDTHYHPLLFSKAKVEAEAEGRLRLAPPGSK